ncbi:cytochrome C oxidase subunit IV family protein [Nocardioides sp. GCM10030258]|uniref:cytochrome C oxidase subunit IV family protein n=1 Tax=unclassified Nocardioides TaxID=2615069 RepID=UPI00361AB662
MNDLLFLARGRATVVWAVLVAATVSSWWMGTHEPSALEGVNGGAGALILAIAFVKVRFVGLDFMEVRHAPIVLRLIFEAYCLTAFVVLAGTLLLA